MLKLQSLAAALLLLGSAGVFSQAGGGKPTAQLAGMVYSEPSPAPDFTLTDQHGSTFRMAQTRGKVVVLTFIYTHCTDVCPFVSLKLKQAQALLGQDAKQVVFVAVTTDPARDTTPVIAAYSKEVGLFDTWHFLTGPEADVKVVWDSYKVGVDIEKVASAGGQQPNQPESEHAQGLKPEDLRLASRVIERFGGGYEVTHTVPFWIIDRAGNFRAILDADAAAQDIAGDARLLIGEK
jgi:protein SCO1/2